ncbi:heparin cofactor 2 [Amia ocellicauda]|uniref:heparin cofactor 2 n=1 Tax=Amia ocellicauda TaxID=2972642 RepID=UPI0034646C43
MWFLTVVTLACLLASPSLAGVKDLGIHFSPSGTVQPIGPRGPASGGAPDMEAIPPEFHKENTVTNDLPFDGGFEEEDYIDFEKLLAEDDDYSDAIDEIDTPVQGVIITAPTDPQVRKAQLLQLFHGQTRLQRLSTVNADFGFKLYRVLRNAANQSDNILFAPVGISIAMGMIDLGTKQLTHQQIYQTLGFGDFVNVSSMYEDLTVHKLFRKLTHRLFRRNFGYTLRSVNDLYVQKERPIVDSFKSNVKNFYFAEPQSVDFRDRTFLSKANQRIVKITKGLIKEALKSVNPDTVLMLLNYLYFKGTWENKFPVELTHHRSFRVNERQTVRVPMMQTKGNFMAAADHELECDILQLPYVGNISMMIAFPRKLSGIRTLEKAISPTVVNKWMSNMTNRTREVVFPKFKLEKNYDLIGYLQEMGVTELFEKTADFSGMTSEKLSIDLFKHQGTITVNEEGTEAAAVTTVGFMPLSTQIRFIVDRPFLFLIYEHRTSCLLFMGRVVNPLNN